MPQHIVTIICLLCLTASVIGKASTAEASAAQHKEHPSKQAAAHTNLEERGINLHLGALSIKLRTQPAAPVAAGTSTASKDQNKRDAAVQQAPSAVTAQTYNTGILPHQYRNPASWADPLQQLADSIGKLLGTSFGNRLSRPQAAADLPARQGKSSQRVPPAAAVLKTSRRPQRAAAAAAAAVNKPLPNVKDGHVPMCEWRPDFNSCMLDRKYLLAIPAKPQSFTSKLVSAAAARDHVCSSLSTPSDCLQRPPASDLLCDWGMGGVSGWDKGCHSTYLTEWTLFATLASNLGAVNASYAMAHAGCLTCPGSMAQQTLACSSLYPMDPAGQWSPDICQKGTGCIFNKEQHSCMTSPSMHSLLATLGPQVVGTCSAACYLRMLNKCSEASRQPAPKRHAWCSKQPGCRWISGKCDMDVWLSKLDGWGKHATAAADKCAQQTGEFECAVAGVQGAILAPSPDRVQQFVRRPVSHGSLNAQCPV